MSLSMLRWTVSADRSGAPVRPVLKVDPEDPICYSLITAGGTSGGAA